MGVIRREIHPEEINVLADQLRVLSHPARLSILNRIAESDSCICTDLSRELGLAQATVSQHLKVLKDGNFIKGNIEGNSVCYCINTETMQNFKGRMDFLFENLTPDDEILTNACCE